MLLVSSFPFSEKHNIDYPLNNPSGINLVRLPRRSKHVSPRVVHPEIQEKPASCNTDQEQVTRINVDSANVPGVRSKSLSPTDFKKADGRKSGSVLLPPLPSAQCLVKRTTADAKHSSGTNVEALPSDKPARKNHDPNCKRRKSVGIQARIFSQRLPPKELQLGSSSFEIQPRHGSSNIPARIPQRELFNKHKPEKTSWEQNTSKALEGLLPRRIPVGLEGGDVIVRSPTTQMATLDDRPQSDICREQKKDYLIPNPYVNDASISISVPEKKLYLETVYSLPSSPTLPRRSIVTRQQRLHNNQTNGSASSVSVPCTNEINNYTSSASSPERKLCPEKLHSAPTSPNIFQRSEVIRQQRFYHNETNSSNSNVRVPCINEVNRYRSSTGAPERKLFPEKVHSAPVRKLHDNKDYTIMRLTVLLVALVFLVSMKLIVTQAALVLLRETYVLEKYTLLPRHRIHFSVLKLHDNKDFTIMRLKALPVASVFLVSMKLRVMQAALVLLRASCVLKRYTLLPLHRIYCSVLKLYDNKDSTIMRLTVYTNSVSASCPQPYPGKLRSVSLSPALSRSVRITQQQSVYRNKA